MRHYTLIINHRLRVTLSAVSPIEARKSARLFFGYVGLKVKCITTEQ